MSKQSRIDNDTILNPSCQKNCNKDKRKQVTENDLCTIVVSVKDNQHVRCVGSWAEQKIYHLVQYFNIFSQGMKNKWGKLNYIEICSGPGRCIDRDTGYEFDGSSLCIIKSNACANINKAIFFDYNSQVVQLLNNRIINTGVTNAIAKVGNYYDATGICNEILKETGGTGLYLVFIDPTDCSVPFSLVKELKDKLKNVDFIINLAIGTDFNRNISNVLTNPVSYQTVLTKYRNFLGNDDFFNTPDINKMNSEKLRLLFRDSYIKSLNNIGYIYTDIKRIRNYYDLVFASANEKGKEFWDKANKIQFNGQRKLDF